ncbi:uncharacterized protein THITE_2064270 [Thermothielavioides terrestris NRRL 8126]|uniref:Uncharacterized protein n=1 Tax=Thermothielavioides terrestris (strain ATCC 38088 / NRRL 8126) TaxID=578455 RepID=G2QYX6_THETT|nr:uncharacterized protein THITE_2064270 [Thermothielavioides terrestris NRRL 8126]AEO67115.1 hypothetical protein THITE_2064270 [Thermothielavioides terrestris NRRL 8126]
MQRKGGRAPAGHLSRLKPVEHDPLAEYGLPSKGEKRLLSPKVQEAYYAKITERYLAFCTAAGDRDELQRQFARLAITDQRNPKPSSASDDFSNQVYLFSIRLGILASSYETYYPSLLYLLRRQPPNPRSRRPGTSPAPPSLPPPQQSQSQPQPHTPHLTTAPQPRAVPLTTVEQADLAAYLILDTACRRGDLAGAYAQRAAHGLRDRHVDAVLRALAADNWAAWRRARRQADLYRATLMEGAERRVRAHALRAIGRAYLTVGVRWVEGQLGMAWDGLREGFGVGWEVEEGGAADGEEEGGKVVVRRVKGK